ncbi:uncharacterized protein LOC120631662 [Pararge aegeria]|uniref:uncharacterized protein LOC120631662 n=1 Tax=Pararge aegeria TaxID=116150 RepID=UPI0019D2AE44|nr:uncharacterized protein LOC120631662 [Pararge aegeria]
MCIQWKCCEMESIYGRSLREGVILVGKASVVISAVILLASVVCLTTIYISDVQINIYPVMAVNLILGLVASGFSVYSIIISLLLLWRVKQSTKGNIFICSMWYVSQMSMLALYLLLFVAKLTVCIARKHYFTAAFTVIIGILYEGVMNYFAIVVNSYLHSLHQERYL